jgi:hypothetical protein
MNNEPTRTHFHADGSGAENAGGREHASPPAAGPSPLRRWSVAELIARAVAARLAEA